MAKIIFPGPKMVPNASQWGFRGAIYAIYGTPKNGSFGLFLAIFGVSKKAKS